MTQNAADDYAEIAKNLRELEGPRHSAPGRYGIWCISASNWIWRIGKGHWLLAGTPTYRFPITSTQPSLFNTIEDAQAVIDLEGSPLVCEVRPYPEETG